MSITEPKGFEAAGGAVGIKESGDPDLAVIATADRRGVSAAGVFTTNLVQAGPVIVSRDHLGDGHAAAVVVNSGNANAATGEVGRRNARRMCELTAAALGVTEREVLVCSTGLIGDQLPMDRLETGIPVVAAEVAPGPDAARAAAIAMMTTDTVAKEAVARIGAASVGGVAKGAAMLAPSMATMLAVLTTDADATPAVLQRALVEAVEVSFDRIIVDGARSTNDTVLVLANGASGAPMVSEATGRAYDELVGGLRTVCGSLAEQMARDAEGATKFVRVSVVGARSDGDAVAAARQVAGSQLVQCSIYGEDPYWGRVISELGASGAQMDPEAIDIAYNGIVVCVDGVAASHDADALAAAMASREIEIGCDLRLAHGQAEILTSDLTHAYVDENMGTS